MTEEQPKRVKTECPPVRAVIVGKMPDPLPPWLSQSSIHVCDYEQSIRPACIQLIARRILILGVPRFCMLTRVIINAPQEVQANLEEIQGTNELRTLPPLEAFPLLPGSRDDSVWGNPSPPGGKYYTWQTFQWRGEALVLVPRLPIKGLALGRDYTHDPVPYKDETWLYLDKLKPLNATWDDEPVLEWPNKIPEATDKTQVFDYYKRLKVVVFPREVNQ